MTVVIVIRKDQDEDSCSSQPSQMSLKLKSAALFISPVCWSFQCHFLFLKMPYERILWINPSPAPNHPTPRSRYWCLSGYLGLCKAHGSDLQTVCRVRWVTPLSRSPSCFLSQVHCAHMDSLSGSVVAGFLLLYWGLHFKLTHCLHLQACGPTVSLAKGLPDSGFKEGKGNRFQKPVEKVFTC